MRVLIAGASGFIGSALMEKLLADADVSEKIEIVALSRRVRHSQDPRVKWKQCDLFSMKDLSEAMDGCDLAYYLVHSMLPSADLSQGSFYDFDLILADNFARCAKKVGLSHIIYLGGMIPKTDKLSWHLRSRLEVEDTLRLSGVKVTTLRAGLIIGPRGSSFELLRRLVERLPLMISPAWTRTESQPIALSEILFVLIECLKRQEVTGRIYDVGGPEVLTYENLILKTALGLGLKRKVYPFNLVPLGFSRFWVCLITGAPKDLVYPLVLSLKHRMVENPAQAWKLWPNARVTLGEAIRDAIKAHDPVEGIDVPKRVPLHKVRSIQRLTLPKGKSAEWIANEYFKWLPMEMIFVIKVRIEQLVCEFTFLSKRIVLLRLEKSAERSSSDRQLLYIKGGILASRNMHRGRLEFREALGGSAVLAAIHDFEPALPWFIYRYTQAVVHLWVMYRFNRYLKRL